ncbi:Amino-acid N-acetyltransferase [Ectocarpus siliculosus]|uniref:amino-acid N-acetyltransferase n=1 Tax=Ectocarpus siliculosus TaxID=2880 RepID=D7FJG3_ECTSI|nr:Amino-acid N-acetyltransferase [Ectocarpus siliculosus]|eukprot:CBJ29066.1 Amino-acid N-acetyltransferase [Ectocarpus siliculosus]
MDALRVRSLSGEGDEETSGSFVDLFRGCAPYIRAHLGAIMVIHMGGEVVEDPNFTSIMDDLGLLRLLGARLVIVTGARPQMSTLLQQAGIKEEFRDDLRVTSKEALKVIKAAAGFVRIEVESALSRGARGGAAGDFHVAGGNFFSAQPVGVRDGVDYGCTGEVRKVEADRIRAQLNEGGVVHLTCIGYSGSGEVFNVNSVDLAAKCAASVGASKLIYIADGYLEDATTGEIINSMRLSEARSLLSRYEKKKSNNGEAVAAGSGAGAMAAVDVEKDSPPAEVEMAGGVAADKEAAVGGGSAGDVHGVEQRLMRLTEKAVMALTQGVSRAHVVPPTSGALLQELYTRDGAGLLISRDMILVPRTPEQLEADINEFFVITRDETVLGVAFFKRYGQDHAEVGCLAIHRDYRKRGWGEAMLSYLERVALASSVKHLFVLSTVTMQWFVERGFRESQVSDLPPERRESYNWERMSKIYHKTLGGGVRAVDAEELLWDVRGMI